MAAVFGLVPFAILPVFGWLFGAAEAARMLLPSTLLAVGFYMNSTLTLPYVLSLAMDRPGIALSLNAWALIAVFPVTLLLVWQLGLTGAALSWVAYHVFAYGYAVPRICRECGDESAWHWYANVGRFFGSAVAMYIVSWGIAMAAGGSTEALALGYAAGTAAYAVAGWLSLSEHARRRVSEALWNRSRVA
jgi:hypothetical protein